MHAFCRSFSMQYVLGEHNVGCSVGIGLGNVAFHPEFEQLEQ